MFKPTQTLTTITGFNYTILNVKYFKTKNKPDYVLTVQSSCGKVFDLTKNDVENYNVFILNNN